MSDLFNSHSPFSKERWNPHRSDARSTKMTMDQFFHLNWVEGEPADLLYKTPSEIQQDRMSALCLAIDMKGPEGYSLGAPGEVRTVKTLEEWISIYANTRVFDRSERCDIIEKEQRRLAGLPPPYSHAPEPWQSEMSHLNPSRVPIPEPGEFGTPTLNPRQKPMIGTAGDIAMFSSRQVLPNSPTIYPYSGVSSSSLNLAAFPGLQDLPEDPNTPLLNKLRKLEAEDPFHPTLLALNPAKKKDLERVRAWEEQQRKANQSQKR